MASLDTPEHHVPVPTMVFLAFVEAALALVNSGLPFLPDDELEYVSVHLERAVADATQEGRVRRTGFARPLASLTGHGTSAAYSAPVLLTPPSMLSSDLGGLEAHVQSLKLQDSYSVRPGYSVHTASSSTLSPTLRAPVQPGIPDPYDETLPCEGSEDDRFYVVTQGLRVGIFSRWEEAAPLVLGVSNAIHRSYKGWSIACAAYRTAWNDGLVKILRSAQA